MPCKTPAWPSGRISLRTGLPPLLLLIALWPPAAALAAPKTDIVVLLNGDKLTGEVKGLSHGQLNFKTDAAGTLSIEWAHIASVQSNQVLQVELSSGLRYLGRAYPGAEAGKLRVGVESEGKGRELGIADVVRIDPIDQGNLMQRLDGYVTAGYDYTKANRLQQFTFSGGLSLRNERALWSVDGATTMTSQEAVEDTGRYDVTGLHRHFLPNRRFWQGFATLEGNDELGLDLRSMIGGAYGSFLVQDSRQEWAAYAGLAATRENFDMQDSADSLELVLGTGYSFFRYEDPEASLDARLNVLPSLTESGRVRSEARLRSRYEIVEDLFFEVSLYGSYDSDADDETNSTTDYGITTSLGYSF